MDKCLSFESFKLFLIEELQNHSFLSNLGNNGMEEIQHVLNPLTCCENAMDSFFLAISYILDHDGKSSSFILLLHYIESIMSHSGLLFCEQIENITRSINSADLTFFILLLLLNQANSPSQIVCCVSLLKEFTSREHHIQLHSFSLHIMSSYLINSFEVNEGMEDLLLFAGEWFATLYELTSFDDCLYIKNLCNLCNHDYDSKWHWLLLNSIIRTGSLSSQLREILIIRLFLPLLEKNKPIKRLSSYPFVLNFLRLLIQQLFPVIPKDYFVLWSDCLLYCHHLLLSSTDDIDSLLMFILYAIQYFSLSIPQINKCLILCKELFPQTSSSTFLNDTLVHCICSLFLNSFYNTNKTILNRGLSLLSSLPLNSISQDMTQSLIRSILWLDASLLKYDLDHSIPYSNKSNRKDCLQLLSHFPLEFQDLVEWLFIPLYPHLKQLPREQDLQTLLAHSVTSSTCLDFTNHSVILDLIYQLLISIPFTPSNQPMSHIVNVITCKSKEGIRPLLQTPYSSLLFKHLIHIGHEDWLEPFLPECCLNDSYMVSTHPSNLVYVLCSFPYSQLQQILIESSCAIQSDRQLLIVLKYLYAANEKAFHEYDQLPNQESQTYIVP